MNFSCTLEDKAFRGEGRDFLRNKLPARIATKAKIGRHLTRADQIAAFGRAA